MTAPSVTWGEAFAIRVARFGGMPRVADRLREALGSAAPARSTLSQLGAFGSPEEMRDVQLLRAYLVLLVIGEDPAAWGIAPDEPPAFLAFARRAILGLGPVSGPQRRRSDLRTDIACTPSHARADLRGRVLVAA